MLRSAPLVDDNLIEAYQARSPSMSAAAAAASYRRANSASSGRAQSAAVGHQQTIDEFSAREIELRRKNDEIEARQAAVMRRTEELKVCCADLFSYYFILPPLILSVIV